MDLTLNSNHFNILCGIERLWSTNHDTTTLIEAMNVWYVFTYSKPISSALTIVYISVVVVVKVTLIF